MLGGGHPSAFREPGEKEKRSHWISRDGRLLQSPEKKKKRKRIANRPACRTPVRIVRKKKSERQRGRKKTAREGKGSKGAMRAEHRAGRKKKLHRLRENRGCSYSTRKEEEGPPHDAVLPQKRGVSDITGEKSGGNRRIRQNNPS